jgi:hypothetical protein
MKVNNSFPITLVVISIPTLVIVIFTYVFVEYYIHFLDICSHYSQRSMVLCAIQFFFVLAYLSPHNQSNMTRYDAIVTFIPGDGSRHQ